MYSGSPFFPQETQTIEIVKIKNNGNVLPSDVIVPARTMQELQRLIPEIESEIKSLSSSIVNYEKILKSKKALLNIIKDELDKINER